jgi:hypothetical protein
LRELPPWWPLIEFRKDIYPDAERAPQVLAVVNEAPSSADVVVDLQDLDRCPRSSRWTSSSFSIKRVRPGWIDTRSASSRSAGSHW